MKWLDRVKKSLGAETDTTETTETIFVVSVAPTLVHFQKNEGATAAANDTASTPTPITATVDIGTRRPPDLSPTLLAASLALDRQIYESGVLHQDPGRHCYPHTQAANGQELNTMVRRLATFARICLPVDDAERLADRLKDRDRDPADERHACVECQHCQGGRCGNWRAAGFITARHNELGTLATALQRCQGFAPGAGSLAPAMAFAHGAGAGQQITAKEPAQYHPLGDDDKQAAQEYHQHHATCPKCQGAGRGYSSRCDTGVALWNQYQEGTAE